MTKIESSDQSHVSCRKYKSGVIFRNVELEATTKHFCFFSFRCFWIDTVSYEYKNRSVNKGTQLVPIEIPADSWKVCLPKTTSVLSMRNSSIFLILTSDNLCVESEYYLREQFFWWLNTKYEYFILLFLLKEQL
jgi:hypothetical protein